jgi:hypothetical protein
MFVPGLRDGRGWEGRGEGGGEEGRGKGLMIDVSAASSPSLRPFFHCSHNDPTFFIRFGLPHDKKNRLNSMSSLYTFSGVDGDFWGIGE